MSILFLVFFSVPVTARLARGYERSPGIFRLRFGDEALQASPVFFVPDRLPG